MAVWLSPPAKRKQIACWQRWKLAHAVRISYGNPRSVLGMAAADVVRRNGGPCAVRDVFQPVAAAPQIDMDPLEPPAELMLGGVLHAYLEAFERAGAGGDPSPEGDVDALVAQSIRAAHDDFLGQLEEAVGQARGARGPLGS